MGKEEKWEIWEGTIKLQGILKSTQKPTTVEASKDIYICARNLNGVTKNRGENIPTLPLMPPKEHEVPWMGFIF